MDFFAAPTRNHLCHVVGKPIAAKREPFFTSISILHFHRQAMLRQAFRTFLGDFAWAVFYCPSMSTSIFFALDDVIDSIS